MVREIAIAAHLRTARTSGAARGGTSRRAPGRLASLSARPSAASNARLRTRRPPRASARGGAHRARR
eukprot:31470-Pelagococcus_subviridis.AAC.2